VSPKKGWRATVSCPHRMEEITNQGSQQKKESLEAKPGGEEGDKKYTYNRKRQPSTEDKKGAILN